MTKNMIFLTFRVNKRPTNVSADDWFVKCYENGMNHRLNRLLNPTFNNKNMEVRFATTFAEVEKLKKPHGDRPANQLLWGLEVCK